MAVNLFSTKKTRKEDDDYESCDIRIDLAEDEDTYYIYADMSGKNIHDIKMKFKGDQLSLRVLEEDDDSNPIANKSCIIQERIHDEQERLISFDDPVDKKKVEARLENGVLIVEIRKMNPEMAEEEDLIEISC